MNGLSKHQRLVVEAAVRHPEMSAKQLGRLLGLPRNAVQCALVRAYRVLGIRSRRELAGVLAAAK